jgi:GT2 family glycosyltransferase
MLLNPDTVPQADALAALVRHLDAHPELVAVGPQLRYGDGSVQSSRRRFPTMATFFWESTPLERLWPRNPWTRRYRCDDTPDTVEQRVGWLVGAALVVRTSAIPQAGLLDEQFFMYSEELEWQMRLQLAVGSRQLAVGSWQSATQYYRQAQCLSGSTLSVSAVQHSAVDRQQSPIFLQR